MSVAWANRSRKDYYWYRKWARPTVLAAAGYRCQIALPGTWTLRNGQVRRCLGVATEAHHIHGLKATGLLDITQMRAACGPCNRKVGDPTKVPDPPHVRSGWLR